MMKINNYDVEVEVVRKKIKNIYFRISEDGKVLVSCPKYVSSYEINKLLENNRSSIEKMYGKYLKTREEKEKILYLGQTLDFVHYKKIMFEGNIAFGPSVKEINEYLEKKSLPIFQKRLDIYAKTYTDLPKFRLRIRKMKSRWGVCNKSSMTITLNSLLIHKDPFLIDYVICHELAHFKYMDHSQKFWKCVEEHYPNYRKARKELKD